MINDINNWAKIIFHIDMNAFFASIEQRDDPKLFGKPIAITNGNKGSCIITCSYEARAFGIKTGMYFSEAKRKCPSLIRCSSNPKKYIYVSSKIMDILYNISPDIEIFSIDEAFLDLSNCKKIYPSLFDVAYLIKDKIFSDLNLPCSIGIAENKSNAKFAAKMQKPDGITVLPPDKSEEILSNYPIKDLCGVSNGIGSFLNNHGVFVCGDMKNIPISILGTRYGNIGKKIWLMAQGKDIDSLKLRENPPKSFGHGKVTKPNLKDIYEIKKILHHMSNKVAKRLRQNNYESNIFLIGLKIKDYWISHKYKISKYTNHDKDIFKLCLLLVNEFYIQKNGIYQVQVTAINIKPMNMQKDLFAVNCDKNTDIDYTIDSINNKFGDLMLRPARLCNKLQTPDVISPSWRPTGHKKSL
tara:strand:- start:43 stop:1278 length:1236 start_codon:yes stop_codon:yes gene_type:complete